jgi:c-di-GMP-binding flagellar brake protein YcgR
MSVRDGAVPKGTTERERRQRRQHERKLVELPVVIEDAANRVRGKVRFDSRDLSVGGAFLRSDLLFEVGEEVRIDFGLPNGHRVHGRGRVVRVARERDDGQEPGMGIEFIALTDQDREAVRAFIARG